NAMATFEAWKEQQAQQQALNRNEEESATVKRFNQQLAEKDATIERLTKNVDEQLNMAIQAKDRATAELAAVTFLEETKRRSFSEVERLKSHLVELEQTYSEEAYRAEDRETDLRKRLQELENQLNNTLQEAQQKR
ncbi:conserved hypothetical protein, partial [Trichinella spiralis]|uniref:hypothetical protein n=1 Tax=Trichinella spiralis TaxID=6334 RepID=UPI0001EFD440